MQPSHQMNILTLLTLFLNISCSAVSWSRLNYSRIAQQVVKVGGTLAAGYPMWKQFIGDIKADEAWYQERLREEKILVENRFDKDLATKSQEFDEHNALVRQFVQATVSGTPYENVTVDRIVSRERRTFMGSHVGRVYFLD